jgi:hypothetical protein
MVTPAADALTARPANESDASLFGIFAAIAKEAGRPDLHAEFNRAIRSMSSTPATAFSMIATAARTSTAARPQVMFRRSTSTASPVAC